MSRTESQEALAEAYRGTSRFGPISGNYFEDIPKYAHRRNKPEEPVNATNTKREEAELADKPTTADGERGNKDLPSVLAQVGAAAAFLPNMYSMMGMITAMIGGRSQTSRKQIIETSLSGALAILVNKWGYDRVINVFDIALQGDNIKQIDEIYRNNVKNAIANLYKAAVEFGPNNVPVYTYSTVTTIGPVPSPLVTTVPDLYIQQYYLQAEDPYPGYIRWNSQDGTEFVFTERKIGDKYYVSPQQEIYSVSEQEMADALDPYIRDENLTAKILNDLLREQDSNIQANTKEKTLGKGTGSGGLNSLRLLLSLIGPISAATNAVKLSQLPFSVMNQGSVSKSLEEYEKNQAEAARLKQQLKQAATPTQSTEQITSLLSPEIAAKAGVKIPQIFTA